MAQTSDHSDSKISRYEPLTARFACKCSETLYPLQVGKLGIVRLYDCRDVQSHTHHRSEASN